MPSESNIAATMLIVKTRSYPGGWRKDAQENKALRSLREEWRDMVDAYGYETYAVHPRTYIDDMGGFTYPSGHEPRLINIVDGKLNRERKRRRT